MVYQNERVTFQPQRRAANLLWVQRHLEAEHALRFDRAPLPPERFARLAGKLSAWLCCPTKPLPEFRSTLRRVGGSGCHSRGMDGDLAGLLGLAKGLTPHGASPGSAAACVARPIQAARVAWPIRESEPAGARRDAIRGKKPADRTGVDFRQRLQMCQRRLGNAGFPSDPLLLRNRGEMSLRPPLGLFHRLFHAQIGPLARPTQRVGVCPLFGYGPGFFLSHALLFFETGTADPRPRALSGRFPSSQADRGDQ